MIKPPFAAPDNKFDMDKWNPDERPEGLSKEMVLLLIQEMKNRKDGKVAPDTTGADYFFLDDFITSDMGLDFPVIEQDFIRHCSEKLSEFNNAGWYGEDERGDGSPKNLLQKKMLRLIYNGAKLGNTYCIELIKNLYKTYHKKEYDQLKRFGSISMDEIFSLSEYEDGDHSYETIGRILGMSRFMNIRQDDSCSFLYLLLGKCREDWLGDRKKEREFLDFREGLFEECIRQIETWEKDMKGKGSDRFYKTYKTYFDYDEFAGNCLRHFGYPQDYIYLCMENNMGLSLQMARTLAVLRTTDSKKEYTFEEVQKCAVLYSAAAALANTAEDFEAELGYLTGDELEDYEKEDVLFKPEKIQIKSEEVKEPRQKPSLINVAPVSSDQAGKEDYLKEIEQLRSRLNQKELENRNLRELYHQSKSLCDEAEQLNRKYEGERDELIALRNFAYKSELPDEETSEKSYADMKKAVAEKDIVIIGGSIAWINKLKLQFPGWLFIHPDAYKNFDGKMFDGKERVYFFTDYLNHISYEKFIAAIRERKIPFGYLGSRNVEKIVKQIYEEVNP